LKNTEATQLSSYCHFREVESGKAVTGRDASIDIFEAIDQDEPKGAPVLFFEACADASSSGAWSLKLEQSARVVLLRSLVWPGFFSYHVPTEGQCGWFYIGTGQKNTDIGFML
jgi:radial spoke head protein 9